MTKKKRLPKPAWRNPEKSTQLFLGDAFDLMERLDDNSVDCVWTDPPYFLSNDGITCVGGKMVQVNKGTWDRSLGVEYDHLFHMQWIKACFRLLKPTGSLWVSGTLHAHSSIGFALQKVGFRLLNDMVWRKKNPPPKSLEKNFRTCYGAGLLG